jgi:thymidylate synthase (FAD)
MKLDVLDKGSVELIDMMGSDQRVLDAARVSTGTSSKGEEQDKKLINYLMKHNHHTPFEKIVFEWHIKCPFFVARQIFRHRIGSFNEESARYKELDFETFFPSKWRMQSKTNHQGSSEEKFETWQQNILNGKLETLYKHSEEVYKDLLRVGVSRELARIVMPMGVYTEFYWTINFRSLMNFLTLRSAPDAQFEIQEYARAMKKIIINAGKIPMTIEAYDMLGGK